MIPLIIPADAATSTAAEAGGIGALGIDVRALLLQVVNFGILLWLLKRFAYRPILAVLRQRRQKVEESLKNAHELEQAKRTLAAEQTRLLRATQSHAQTVIAQGKQQADELIAQAKAAAREHAAQIVAEGTARLQQEETRLRQALRQEMTGLVREATRRVVGRTLTAAGDEALITEALKDLKA